jgi:hypothetical protein
MKKKNVRPTLKSSSGGKKAKSKTHQEVLELGKILVKDLQLDQSDILGRWMAHHVAELLGSVQGNKKNPDKDHNEKIENTITRLWAKRSLFQNRINPLAELKPIIEVLHTLDPSKNGWILHDDGFRRTYDIFRRLMIFLVLWKSNLSEPKQKIDAAQRTTKFQSSEERQLISAFHLWFGEQKVLRSDFKSSAGRKNKAEDVELADIGDRLITEAQGVLESLKKTLKEKAESKAKSNSVRKSK